MRSLILEYWRSKQLRENPRLRDFREKFNLPIPIDRDSPPIDPREKAERFSHLPRSKIYCDSTGTQIFYTRPNLVRDVYPHLDLSPFDPPPLARSEMGPGFHIVELKQKDGRPVVVIMNDEGGCRL
jgi:hypothetical protein